MYEVFKLIYYLLNTYLCFIENKNENESDSKNNKLQTSDDKLNKNLPDKYVNKGLQLKSYNSWEKRMTTKTK